MLQPGTAATIWRKQIFDFLPVRAELDLKGWLDEDIFAH